MSTGNWASSGEDQWTSACPRAVRGGLAPPPRRVAKIRESNSADMIVLCSFLLRRPERRVSRTAARSWRHRRRRGIRLCYPLRLRATSASPPVTPRARGASRPSIPHASAGEYFESFFFYSGLKSPIAQLLRRWSQTARVVEARRRSPQHP